jgi:hypothetical protein
MPRNSQTQPTCRPGTPCAVTHRAGRAALAAERAGVDAAGNDGHGGAVTRLLSPRWLGGAARGAQRTPNYSRGRAPQFGALRS